VTVAVVGADVQRFQAGDKVCALLLGGGYATKLVRPYSNPTEQPKSSGATPPERDPSGNEPRFVEAAPTIGAYRERPSYEHKINGDKNAKEISSHSRRVTDCRVDRSNGHGIRR
jgi:hypothetical protein